MARAGDGCTRRGPVSFQPRVIWIGINLFRICRAMMIHLHQPQGSVFVLVNHDKFVVFTAKIHRAEVLRLTYHPASACSAIAGSNSGTGKFHNPAKISTKERGASTTGQGNVKAMSLYCSITIVMMVAAFALNDRENYIKWTKADKNLFIMLLRASLC